MAESSEKSIGYILKSSDYNDSSSMVNMLSPDGVVSFSARGIHRPGSKWPFVSTQLVKMEATFAFSKDGRRKTLVGAKLLSYPRTEDSFDRGVAFAVTSEAISSLVREEDAGEAYLLLDAFMGAMERKEHALTALSAFIAKLVRLIGYGIEVDGCAVCKAKEGIVGLSFQDGGFLCREHAGYAYQPGAQFLKELRYVNKLRLTEPFPLAVPDADCVSIVEQYSRHIEDLTGTKLKAVDLLKAL